MKRLLILPFLFFLFGSCSKSSPIPTVYIGTWKAESAQFLTLELRQHTLVLSGDGRGHYSTAGNGGIFERNEKGKVKINDETLYLNDLEFKITSPPQTDSTGETRMTLDHLVYTSQ